MVCGLVCSDVSTSFLGRVIGFTAELFSPLSCFSPAHTHTRTDTLRQDVCCFFTKNVKELCSNKEDTMLCHNADGSHLREECVIGGLISYHCL